MLVHKTGLLGIHTYSQINTYLLLFHLIWKYIIYLCVDFFEEYILSQTLIPLYTNKYHEVSVMEFGAVLTGGPGSPAWPLECITLIEE